MQIPFKAPSPPPHGREFHRTTARWLKMRHLLRSGLTLPCPTPWEATPPQSWGCAGERLSQGLPGGGGVPAKNCSVVGILPVALLYQEVSFQFLIDVPGKSPIGSLGELSLSSIFPFICLSQYKSSRNPCQPSSLISCSLI